MSRITVLVPPTVEPVDIETMKLQSNVIDDTQEPLLAEMIAGAREDCEHRCNRSFLQQTLLLTLDAFPGPSLIGVPYGVPYSLPGHAILLERGPVQSVTSIQYQDMSGTWQTMPSADYVADLSGPMPRITPVFGKIWPITLPQIGAVKVTYVAGYGTTASAVPAGVRNWIRMRAATLYENREEVAILGRGKVEMLPYVNNLLDAYRVTTL
jgi:uncharacterized phiE125 gp8 family phage protein